MSAHPQSTLRLLAPAALVVFAIVFLIVVIASLGGDDQSSSGDRPVSTASERQRDRPQRRERRRTRPRTTSNARFYVVRAGDSLAVIAERTGVPLAELRLLNPSLDPQGLVTGQRVRLRAAGATGATGASGASGTTGARGDATFEGGVAGE